MTIEAVEKGQPSALSSHYAQGPGKSPTTREKNDNSSSNESNVPIHEEKEEMIKGDVALL